MNTHTPTPADMGEAGTVNSRGNSMIAAVFGNLPAWTEGSVTSEHVVAIERARADAKVAAAIQWARDNGLQDKDETERLLGTVGRNPSVHVFNELFAKGLLPEDADVLVGSVWNAAEFPSLMLDSWEWEELFNWSGYRHDGLLAKRPKAALTLYRGAPDDYRDGMAWTSSLEMAEWFATRNRDHFGFEARVWTAMVEPYRLLCRVDDRKEDEYVVQTGGLDIRSLSDDTEQVGR